ncbi:hypothetical protein ACG7TL_007937 [Trametes sanguinea]
MLAFLQAAALADEGMEDIGEPIPGEVAGDIHTELRVVYEFLGIDPESDDPPLHPPLPPLILCTNRVECTRCSPNEARRSLRRRVDPQDVQVLTSDLKWRKARLLIGHCVVCKSDYYPDCYTYATPNSGRFQALEYSPSFLRISKHGLWADHKVALAQEHALVRFRAGWSNFADWLNDQLPNRPRITHRQSRRLFLEHFSRRLLIAHGKQELFSLPAHSTAAVLAESVRQELGVNGGVFPRAFDHGCAECTHTKRYHADLAQEGFVAENGGNMAEVAGIAEEEVDGDVLEVQAAAAPVPEGVPALPANQQAPDPGQTRGYVRMAVMDGKTITHRKCALEDCRQPLVDFRKGRFCAFPWGAYMRSTGSQGMRIIRRQQAEPRAATQGNLPILHVELPPLGDTPGDTVIHTFRAKTIYCLETIQWACGMPIGWGKCYKSESAPQVLEILNQNPHDSWIQTTKFIVDAWHYIGHKASDMLCRLWMIRVRPINWI